MDHRFTLGRFKITAHHCCGSICFTIRRKEIGWEEIVSDGHDEEAWMKWGEASTEVEANKIEYDTWTKMLEDQLTRLVANEVMTQEEADRIRKKWKSEFPLYNPPEEEPGIEVTDDYEKLKEFQNDLAKRVLTVERVKMD